MLADNLLAAMQVLFLRGDAKLQFVEVGHLNGSKDWSIGVSLCSQVVLNEAS